MLVPLCEVCVPLTALAVASVEAARTPHLPVNPASETVATLTLWHAGAAVLAVDVTGPSLPVCPLVATIIGWLSKSGFTSYPRFPIKTAQVVLVPRLITYPCYCLLDQNDAISAKEHRAGRADSSFGHVGLQLCCVNQNGANSAIGTTQVALSPPLIIHLC